MNGDVGMPCAINVFSLNITVKDTSTIMCNPLPGYVGREKVGSPKGGVAMLPTTPTGLDGGIGC